LAGNLIGQHGGSGGGGVKIRQEAQDVMNRVFLLSHVYDDQLLSAAKTAATPGGEFSVQKRRQLLPKCY